MRHACSPAAARSLTLRWQHIVTHLVRGVRARPSFEKRSDRGRVADSRGEVQWSGEVLRSGGEGGQQRRMQSVTRAFFEEIRKAAWRVPCPSSDMKEPHQST